MCNTFFFCLVCRSCIVIRGMYLHEDFSLYLLFSRHLCTLHATLYESLSLQAIENNNREREREKAFHVNISCEKNKRLSIISHEIALHWFRLLVHRSITLHKAKEFLRERKNNDFYCSLGLSLNSQAKRTEITLFCR